MKIVPVGGLIEPWLPGCRVVPGRGAGLPGGAGVVPGWCRGGARVVPGCWVPGAAGVLPGAAPGRLPGAAGSCQAVRTVRALPQCCAGGCWVLPGLPGLPGCRVAGSGCRGPCRGCVPGVRWVIVSISDEMLWIWMSQ